MKKNSFETVLYSTIGVVALLLILVAFNAITSAVKGNAWISRKAKPTRLSAGRGPSCKKLDTPVKIRSTITGAKAGAQETVMLKTYAQHVEDMLAEYKQAAEGLKSFRKI